MRKKNVMTVESFDKPTSRQMLNNLYQNASFAEFNVSHCFIGGVTNADELFERLLSHIKVYKISIMLIHTGLEFSRLSVFFPSVLQKLSSRFKNLAIGLQRREMQSQDITKYVSKGKIIQRLEVRFFSDPR